MTKTTIYQSEGLVLRESSYKESSKILRVLTEDYGLISLMAQGAKKSKSKIFSISQLNSQAIFSMRKGSSFYYLQEGELIDSHFPLRRDIYKFTNSSLMEDLVLRSLVDGQKEPRIYSLLTGALFALETWEENYLLISASFIFKDLSLLGYRPNISECSICGTKKFTRMAFSIKSRGIVCQDCISEGPCDLFLDQKGYYDLRSLMSLSFKDLKGYPLEDKSVKDFFILSIRLFFDLFDLTYLKSLNMLKGLYYIDF